MMWTIFVVSIAARLIGDAIWHFLQLWLSGQGWYQNIVMKISCVMAKKIVDDMEEEL